MHIFLDESGNFSQHDHEEYFVIGTFTVGDQRRTDKSMRKWFREKFPRKMRVQSEIKWSASGISDDLRLRTIKHIAKQDVRIRYGFMLRKNIPAKYVKNEKINSGILYTNVVSEVLEKYLPTDEKNIHIFCDRRSLKGMTKQDFEKAISAHLAPRCSPDTLIKVEMINSTSNGNMQIVDWISGALARYCEKKNGGEEFYRILKNNFLEEGFEFFQKT